MNKFISLCLFFFHLSFSFAFADTIYIIGEDNNNSPAYWTIFPPGAPSSNQELDMGSNTSSDPRSVAFSPNQTVYIVGDASDDNDNAEAVYWTVSTSGTASPINAMTGTSSSEQPVGNSIAFAPSGVGYIVGLNEFGNAAYWTISTQGVVSSATELGLYGSAAAVGFTSSGAGYIVGTDSSYNVCYWSISPTGVISGPYGLVGGEVGGAAYAYAVAASSSGNTYIVGANTGGFACYWTISSLGVASSANVLDGGFNSQARDVAFLPSGAGIIVGQGSGNVSCYWTVSADGNVGTLQSLPNGSGSSSSAYAVAYSSTDVAYIVGSDNSFQAVYWTLSSSNSTPEYHLLDSGGIGICFDIAIYKAPKPPENLSGRYVTNDFGWIYEDCVVLNWTSSSSSGVVAYNIYKDGVKIATVSASKTQYQNHNQKKSIVSTYAVTAVDASGNESSPITVTIH